MNNEDKKWLEKCIKEPKRYEISVDNDYVSVWDKKLDDSAHTFSEYGYTFALQLLKYLGCNAEMV